MTPISTKELELYEKHEADDFNGGPIMPLSEHLEDLRKKIIISLVSFCLFTFICFSFSGEIVKLLTEIAPKGTNFLQIKPGEFFFTSLRVSLYFGLGISLPVITWQLSSFIFPGLTQKEKKIAVPILAFSPILFFIGSVFAYFFVVPSMLNFLFGFSKGLIPSSISIESFVSFSLMIMAICGFVFLVPVVLFALANVGIINSKTLIKKWQYAILGSVILGAILTPTPDPFNMSIVSGVLIALYFLSLAIIRVVGK
jgi:sec-independent protein translocase protein TatC